MLEKIMQINLFEELIHSKKFFAAKNKATDDQSLIDRISKEVYEVLSQLKSFDIISERMSIYKDDRYEIVICNWAAKSSRDWHYHPNIQCWFKCLYGEIIEHRPYKKSGLQMGESGYIDDSLGPHQIENIEQHCAITLHVYKQIGI